MQIHYKYNNKSLQFHDFLQNSRKQKNSLLVSVKKKYKKKCN